MTNQLNQHTLPPGELFCELCGAEQTRCAECRKVINSPRKTCSDACRQRLHRRRMRDAQRNQETS